jgi:hypothetical protein
MRNRFSPILLACAVGAVVLAGCAAQSPVLDRKFGAAVQAARAMQAIDPEAGRTSGAVDGIDGPAAAAAMERYRASFKTPPASVNVFNIGVGSSAGGR